MYIAIHVNEVSFSTVFTGYNDTSDRFTERINAVWSGFEICRAFYLCRLVWANREASA